MTVASTVRRKQFLGNDATTEFDFSFKTFDRADLQVVLTDSAGDETTLTLDSHYSVSLNFDQDASPGGTITYPLSGDPLATGEKLTVTGVLAASQETNLANAGGFFSETLEDRLDYITILIQEQAEKIARAVLASASDDDPVLSLQTAAKRAGKFPSFDADGNLELAQTLPEGSLTPSTVEANLSQASVGRVFQPETLAETTAGVTPSSFPYPPGDALRFGNDGPAIQEMLDAAVAEEKAFIIIPPGDYHAASQILLTAPAARRIAVYAYGAKITTENAISGFAMTGGSSTGGATVFGLQVNHRDNPDATFGFDIFKSWNARLQDCSVEADDVAASYAAYLLRNGTASDDSTGSFWSLLDHCHVRRRGSADGSRAPVGVLLRGAANATILRDCNIGDVDKCIHHTVESGQTTVANALLVTGCAFEGYTTAYHCEGASSSNLAGNRLIGNRFENGTTMFSLTGTTVSPSQPTLAALNMMSSNAGTYLNNPESLIFNSLDLSITPGGRTHLRGSGRLEARNEDNDDVLSLIAKAGFGIVVTSTADVDLARLAARTGGGALLDGPFGLWATHIKGVSSSGVESKNLAGTVTFESAATATVTFSTAEPDTAYFIALGPYAGETFHITGKTVNGFTLNSSNVSSAATVEWHLLR